MVSPSYVNLFSFRRTTMKYLLWCANEHIEFRSPELQAVTSTFQIPVQWIEKPTEDPYIIVGLENEKDASQLISRSMLVRSCYELWGYGTSEEELHNSIQKNCSGFIKNHLSKEKDFKITVKAFNKTLTKTEKLQKIETFSYIPFEGKVNLANPQTSLYLIEYYGLSPNCVPEKPYKYFFGRWLADGQRELIQSYTLKKRKFIGSTSMDAQLAFVMTNVAQIKSGDIVVDPFAGTGSILVSAAQRGAFIWGWDINFMTLHGRTKPTRYSEKIRKPDESVLSNLEQYGLSNRYLDVAVMDSSNVLWRRTGIIDAIITDPPYGIRESTEKVGISKVRKELSSEQILKTDSENLNGDENEDDKAPFVHYPSKMSYNLSDILIDLLNFAASNLALNGRLVFWLPVFRDEYTKDIIPIHPCLQLEYNCEQILNTHSSRRLLTMIKVREPKSDETANADLLSETEEFRKKFFQASQTMTKEERQARKQIYPRDKRGQGLGYRLCDVDDSEKLTIGLCSNDGGRNLMGNSRDEKFAEHMK